MKIKIIDLFNKIANNEKVPNHIISNNVVFHYDDNVQDYENDFEYLFRDSFSNFDRSEDFLNLEVEEVEIIEEEKEIEKIGEIYDGFTDSYYDTCLETTIKKVDEIIDVVNKLKKEIEKKNR